MRRLVLCAVAAAAISGGAAFAQDTRTSSGPYGADFSGVELGPDVGFAIGSSGPYYSSGAAVGGHIGYNIQGGGLVGGVEADGLATNVSSGQSGLVRFNEKFLTSLRGKGGYAFGNLLAYGTIGPAWGSTEATTWYGSHGTTVGGLAFGVGAEYSITRNVSLRAELLRYQFGDVSYNWAYPYVSQTVNASNNMLRIGGSVHF
jgi:outer membrane immunogenic protein